MQDNKLLLTTVLKLLWSNIGMYVNFGCAPVHLKFSCNSDRTILSMIGEKNKIKQTPSCPTVCIFIFSTWYEPIYFALNIEYADRQSLLRQTAFLCAALHWKVYGPTKSRRLMFMKSRLITSMLDGYFYLFTVTSYMFQWYFKSQPFP